jgi:hypothetical protein
MCTASERITPKCYFKVVDERDDGKEDSGEQDGNPNPVEQQKEQNRHKKYRQQIQKYGERNLPIRKKQYQAVIRLGKVQANHAEAQRPEN